VTGAATSLSPYLLASHLSASAMEGGRACRAWHRQSLVCKWATRHGAHGTFLFLPATMTR